MLSPSALSASCMSNSAGCRGHKGHQIEPLPSRQSQPNGVGRHKENYTSPTWKCKRKTNDISTAEATYLSVPKDRCFYEMLTFFNKMKSQVHLQPFLFGSQHKRLLLREPFPNHLGKNSHPPSAGHPHPLTALSSQCFSLPALLQLFVCLPSPECQLSRSRDPVYPVHPEPPVPRTVPGTQPSAVCVSKGCHSNIPHAGGLKATDAFFHGPGTSNPKSRCWQDQGLSEGSGEDSSLSHPCSLVCSYISPVSTTVFTQPSSSVSLFRNLHFYKGQSLDEEFTLTQYDLILTTKTRFPNKITFTDTRDQVFNMFFFGGGTQFDPKEQLINTLNK